MPDLSKYILRLSSSLYTWASPSSSCGHRAMQGCDRRRRNLWPHLHDTPEKHCHFFDFSAITCYPSDTSVKVSTKWNKPLSEPCGNSPNNFKQGPKLNIKPQSFGAPKVLCISYLLQFSKPPQNLGLKIAIYGISQFWSYFFCSMRCWFRVPHTATFIW